MQTDGRGFTVKSAGILFRYTIKEQRGTMNLFGFKNGFAKVTPLINYQESARRAKGK
jgi:hypothetical protein